MRCSLKTSWQTIERNKMNNNKIKAALFFILFSSASMSFAEIVDAPPPQVAEDNLNLTAKELQAIQKSEPAAVAPQSETDKGRSVRTTQSSNGDMIEEYYQGGQVYQIKVTPRIGKPYYIQPENADQTEPNRTNPTSNWKLFDF